MGRLAGQHEYLRKQFKRSSTRIKKVFVQEPEKPTQVIDFQMFQKYIYWFEGSEKLGPCLRRISVSQSNSNAHGWENNSLYSVDGVDRSIFPWGIMDMGGAKIQLRIQQFYTRVYVLLLFIS